MNNSTLNRVNNLNPPTSVNYTLPPVQLAKPEERPVQFNRGDGFGGSQRRGKFQASSRRNPCPVCGGTSGKCRSTDAELVLCMEHDHDVPGWKYLGQTKDYLWGKFIPEGDDRPAPQPREYSPKVEERRIVPDSLKDREYRAILSQLSLSDRHLADFERRNLTTSEIEYLSGVTRSLPDGYLIPFPDVHGQFVGAQKRLDNPDDGGRYRWHYYDFRISLHNQFNEKPLAVYRNGSPVWIVEGTGVKPAIASHRHGVTAIGAAGGMHHNSPQTLRDTLEKLGSPTSVVLCPDAGDIENRHVMRRIPKNIELLEGLGVSVSIAWWGQFAKDDPDIDELQNLDGVQYLSPAEFYGLARPTGETIAPAKRHTAQTLTDATAIEFDPGERLSAYRSAKAKVILDQSGTGSGKTHFDAGLRPEDLGVKQIIYVSQDAYNPTVPELQKWTELAGKHGGLKSELMPDGTTRLTRCKPGEAYTVAPNCIRSGVAQTLRDANIKGADSSSVLCGTCPVKEQCSHSFEGIKFLAQRRRALGSDRLRCNPESLPDPAEFDYSNTALIWDDTTPRAHRTIEVSRDDVARTMADLAVAGISLDLSPLYTLLSQEKLPRYGLTTDQILETARVQAEPELAEKLAPELIKLLTPETIVNAGIDLADLPKEQRKFYAQDVTTGIKNLAKQWLSEYLQICQGLAGASLHINYGKLTLTLPDDRFRKIIQASKLTIIQDATTNTERTALRLGIDPKQITTVRERQCKLTNLRLLQVSDLGTVTRLRGKDQERRINAIISAFPCAMAIDFKGKPADGSWWVDSRGSNAFQNAKTLILVGTPYKNLGAVHAEYCATLGQRVSLDDEGFEKWYGQEVTADITQAAGADTSGGRLRANRRTDEQLTVILLSDFPLQGWEQLKAEDITPAAADKKSNLWQRIKDYGLKLASEGIRVTQEAIAQAIGVTQGRVCQIVREFQGSWEDFKKLLILLLDTSSEINNPDPDPDPDLTQTLLDLICELPPAEILQDFWDYWQSYGMNQVMRILNLASFEQRERFKLAAISI